MQILGEWLLHVLSLENKIVKSLLSELYYSLVFTCMSGNRIVESLLSKLQISFATLLTGGSNFKEVTATAYLTVDLTSQPLRHSAAKNQMSVSTKKSCQYINYYTSAL